MDFWKYCILELLKGKSTDHQIYTGGTPDHPAREFWAYRHVELKEVQDATGQISKRLEFLMKGRAASYFLYG